jgi:hypothetical protein
MAIAAEKVRVGVPSRSAGLSMLLRRKSTTQKVSLSKRS